MVLHNRFPSWRFYLASTDFPSKVRYRYRAVPRYFDIDTTWPGSKAPRLGSEQRVLRGGAGAGCLTRWGRSTPRWRRRCVPRPAPPSPPAPACEAPRAPGARPLQRAIHDEWELRSYQNSRVGMRGWGGQGRGSRLGGSLGVGLWERVGRVRGAEGGGGVGGSLGVGLWERVVRVWRAEGGGDVAHGWEGVWGWVYENGPRGYEGLRERGRGSRLGGSLGVDLWERVGRVREAEGGGDVAHGWEGEPGGGSMRTGRVGTRGWGGRGRGSRLGGSLGVGLRERVGRVRGVEGAGAWLTVDLPVLALHALYDARVRFQTPFSQLVQVVNHIKVVLQHAPSHPLHECGTEEWAGWGRAGLGAGRLGAGQPGWNRGWPQVGRSHRNVCSPNNALSCQHQLMLTNYLMPTNETCQRCLLNSS